ncbi:MAG: hypothetical protein HKN33_11655 [Pyrinomonadaceae bacterium]|nr:hypothetical protein [Pyrinomonadaceae bacterium]
MIVLFLTLFLFVNADSKPTSWDCTNPIEITCDGKTCVSSEKDAFTPMRVTIASDGSMEVCAYTGCWQGTGKVLKNESQIVFAGTDLRFSTAPESKENILIGIDSRDNVGFVKAGAFSHPLVCKVREQG